MQYKKDNHLKADTRGGEKKMSVNMLYNQKGLKNNSLYYSLHGQL